MKVGSLRMALAALLCSVASCSEPLIPSRAGALDGALDQAQHAHYHLHAVGVSHEHVHHGSDSGGHAHDHVHDRPFCSEATQGDSLN